MKITYLLALLLPASSTLLPMEATKRHHIDYQEKFKEAIENNDIKRAEELFPNIEVDYAYGDKKQTAVHITAANGDNKALHFLITHQATVNTKDTDGRIPLHYAAAKGHTTTVNILLAFNAAKAQDKDSATPLPFGINEHTKAEKILLNHKVNIEARDLYGRTPLHYAAANGCTTTVKLLLAYNANIKAQDEDDATPLHLAINGHTKIVKLLLYHEANIEATDMLGRTPLHYATANGCTDVVQILLDSSAELGTHTYNSETALHTAAANGYPKIIKLLIDYGAPFELKTNNNKTCLYYAALNGHTETCKTLLSYLYKSYTSEHNITKIRERLTTALLCFKRIEDPSTLARTIPKDVQREIILSIQELRDDAAHLLIHELQHGNSIESTSLLNDTRVKEVASRFILAASKELLTATYEQLKDRHALEHFFSPDKQEEQILPCIKAGITTKIKTLRPKAAPIS